MTNIAPVITTQYTLRWSDDNGQTWAYGNQQIDNAWRTAAAVTGRIYEIVLITPDT